MANPHDHPTALKELQDSIYREKVLRARAMTPEQRLSVAFELTNKVSERMLAGAMWRLGTQDRQAAWVEVPRQMARLFKAHEHGQYVTQKPENHDH